MKVNKTLDIILKQRYPNATKKEREKLAEEFLMELQREFWEDRVLREREKKIAEEAKKRPPRWN
jgi:hypothetical protein